MKTCANCGEILDDSVKFCKKCGAPCNSQPTGGYGNDNNGTAGNGNNSAYGAGASYNNGGTTQSYGASQGYNGQMNQYQNPSRGYPVSVGGWIGRSLGLAVLSCIPIVGFIVYIIILVMWSKDISKEETFRNWAKAQIVVMIIIVVVVAIIAAIIALSGYALTESLL